MCVTFREREEAVGLNKEDAIRVELRDCGTQKGGRWKLRQNYYVFNCIKCNKEISFLNADLHRMSGRCRSCADKDTALLSSIHNRIRPYEALYNKFRYDRQRTNTECDITYDEFLEFVKIRECHYCKAGIYWAECSIGKNGQKYNLDRKDNTKGYLKNNLVVCCWDCNEVKSNRFSYEQFLVIGDLIRTWRGEKPY